MPFLGAYRSVSCRRAREPVLLIVTWVVNKQHRPKRITRGGQSAQPAAGAASSSGVSGMKRASCAKLSSYIKLYHAKSDWISSRPRRVRFSAEKHGGASAQGHPARAEKRRAQGEIARPDGVYACERE